MNDNEPNLEEAARLIEVLCREQISAEAMRRLESLILSDAAVCNYYVRYLHMHASLPCFAADRDPIHAALAECSAARKEAPALKGKLRGKARVLQLLKRARLVGGSSPVSNALTWLIMLLTASGIAMTFVFIGLIVHGKTARNDLAGSNQGRGVPDATAGDGSEQAAANDPARQASTIPSTIARLTRAIDCRWAGGRGPKVGDDLWPGKKLTLESGLAEIIFQGGARTVLQGPATLEIRARDVAYLASGKFTVRVEDPLVRGFVVLTPGMKYTDLGTEFGLWVAEDGSQEMHVFRGKVRAQAAMPASEAPSKDELKPESAAPAIVLSANQAIHVDRADKPFVPIAADDRKFIRASRIPTLVAEQAPEFRRWKTSRDGLCERQDVVAYYDFQPDEADRAVLRNRSAGGQKLDGRIEGAKWCAAGFSGKKALRFNGKSDSVRVDIPGRFEVLTIAARVKLHSLLSPYASLLDSDGWHMALGQCHWQIQNNGRLEMAPCLMTEPRIEEKFNTTRSRTAVLVEADGDKWIQLATVYDSHGNTIAYYKNGRLCETLHPPITLVPVVFGPSEIGNWDDRGERVHVKNLAGEVAELVLVARAMSAAEVKSLYESGGP